MDIYETQPDWKQTPWVIGLLLVFFFPVGLYLVWNHPAWQTTTKWIITGVIVFFVLLVASQDKGKAPNNAPVAAKAIDPVPTQQAKAAPAHATSPPSKDESGFELGKEFQLGDYKYKVISVEKRQQIGKEVFGEFVGERADAGATFVIVTYTIENCTNESQTVLSDDFTLIDAQGRKYDTSSKVSTALMLHEGDKDFLLSQLQPGLPRRMQQGFELPEVLESELTLLIPKKGLFSLGEARLKVRVP